MDVIEPSEASAPFSRPSSSSSSSSDPTATNSNTNTSSSSSGSSSSSNKDSIWIEKYRPQTLDDVVGNEEVLQRLRIIALEGNMPHLLLAVNPKP